MEDAKQLPPFNRTNAYLDHGLPVAWLETGQKRGYLFPWDSYPGPERKGGHQERPYSAF